MKTNRFSFRTIPLAFLTLTILTYGLLLPWMGLYWDDWPFLWNVTLRGPGEVIGIFEHSRPFLGPITWLTASLIPATPLSWQVFGLFMRFVTGLSAWFCLQTVWPDSRRHALTASLLFLVYPAFTQQWIPVTYASQHFITLSAYLLSLGISVRAARGSKYARRDAFLAAGLLIIGLLPIEYFIGLETLRPLFLWQIPGTPSQTSWQKIRFVFKRWLPYLAIWIANLLWLGYFYQTDRYQYYDPAGLAETKLLPATLTGIRDLGAALLTGGGLGWIYGVKNLWGTPEFMALVAVLILLIFLLVRYYLAHLDLGDSQPNQTWPRHAILLGLVGLLVGRLPSWVAGLPLRFNFGWDRLFLPMILGAAILLAGLLALVKSEPRRIVLTSLIIALAVGQHLGHACTYQQDWAQQREFFWQLAWRIPDLKPQTVLLAPELPLTYETDLSLTAPINWMYAPQNTSDKLSYVLLYPALRQGGPKLPQLVKGVPVEFEYSTTKFTGSTSNAVVLYMPTGHGCLKVLDSTYNNDKTIPGLDPNILPAITLSHPDRILLNAPTPALPEALFGREPAHKWCFYYEKAELARQAANWPAVVQAGRQALNQGLAPKDPAEWLIFIEGYARTGNLPAAEELSRTIWGETPYLKYALCTLWRRLGDEVPYTQTAGGIREKMGCKR